MTHELVKIILCFVLGHTFGWFSINSQLVWPELANWPMTTMLLVAVPASLCFWYGTKLGYAALGTLWSIRFIAFSASYFAFPVITYFMMGESMFTAKTLSCVLLSMVILAIQIFWK